MSATLPQELRDIAADEDGVRHSPMLGEVEPATEHSLQQNDDIEKSADVPPLRDYGILEYGSSPHYGNYLLQDNDNVFSDEGRVPIELHAELHSRSPEDRSPPPPRLDSVHETTFSTNAGSGVLPDGRSPTEPDAVSLNQQIMADSGDKDNHSLSDIRPVVAIAEHDDHSPTVGDSAQVTATSQTQDTVDDSSSTRDTRDTAERQDQELSSISRNTIDV